MEQRALGRTGLKVSELCLGTMTFGGQCDEATSFAILDRAAAGGIGHVSSFARPVSSPANALKYKVNSGVTIRP